MVELSQAAQAKIAELKQQRRDLDAELRQAETNRQAAMKSFREGTISQRKLQQQEKQTGNTRDRIIKARGRIDKEINDFTIRAAGLSTERQKEAVFKTEAEIRSREGKLTRRAKEQIAKTKERVDIEKLKASERTRRIKETTAKIEKRAKEEKRVLTQKEADVSLAVLQRRGVEVQRPLEDVIAEQFPPPRPSKAIQETIRLDRPEIFPVDIEARAKEAAERFPPEQPFGFQETAMISDKEFQKFVSKKLITPVESLPPEREFTILQPEFVEGEIGFIKRASERLKTQQRIFEEKAGPREFVELVPQPTDISATAAGASLAGALFLESISTKKKLEERAKVAIESAAITAAITALKVPPVVAGGIVAGFTIEEAFKVKEILKEPIPEVRRRELAAEGSLILAAIGGGGIGAKVSGKIFPPTEAVATVPKKGTEVLLTETFKDGQFTQKIAIQEFIKKDVTLRTEVEPFTRKVTLPKDTLKLVEFLERPDIRPEFRIGEAGIERVIVQDVPGGTRVFQQEVTPLEIRARAKAEVTLREEALIPKVKAKDLPAKEFAEFLEELGELGKVREAKEIPIPRGEFAVGELRTPLPEFRAKGAVPEITLKKGLVKTELGAFLKVLKEEPIGTIDFLFEAAKGATSPKDIIESPLNAARELSKLHPTKKVTLQHELIHLTRPELSEAKVLALERKINRFEARTLTEETVRTGKEVPARTEEPFDIVREIDPAKFEFKEVGEELILTKKVKVKAPFGIVKAELAGVGKITGILKRAKGKVADVLGLGIDLPPQDLLIKTTGKGRTALSLEPISRARFGLAQPSELEEITIRGERGKPFIDFEKKIRERTGAGFVFETDVITEREKVTKPKIKVDVKAKERFGFPPIFDVTTEVKPKTGQVLILELEQEQEPEPRAILDIEARAKEEEILKIEEKIDTRLGLAQFGTPRLKEKRKKQFDAFDVTAREKGKDVKLNKFPLSREAAQDLGSEVVDNTLSARFRVRQRKKKVSKQPKDRRTGHFLLNRFKFRDFTTDRQGRRTGPLPKGERIERRGSRLDSPGEVKEITIAKFLAEKKKQFVGIEGNQQIANRLDLFGNQKQPKRKLEPMIQIRRGLL